jgi:hypothetical protein
VIIFSGLNFVFVLTGGLLPDSWWSAAAATADPVPAGTQTNTVSLDSDPHLLGWWKFDETAGKRAADSSKHGHDGTLEGGLSFDTH